MDFGDFWWFSMSFHENIMNFDFIRTVLRYYLELGAEFLIRNRWDDFLSGRIFSIENFFDQTFFSIEKKFQPKKNSIEKKFRSKIFFVQKKIRPKKKIDHFFFFDRQFFRPFFFRPFFSRSTKKYSRLQKRVAFIQKY